MRKTLILTLVLCVFASLAYAQTGSAPAAGSTGSSTSSGSTTGSTTSTTTTTTTKSSKKHHAAASHSVKGSVASVGDKSFAVHPKKGDDVTVKVNDKTTYHPKGKTWDDVKAGANVTVKYHNDGTDNWALSVTFAKEAAAAPAKTGR